MSFAVGPSPDRIATAGNVTTRDPLRSELVNVGAAFDEQLIRALDNRSLTYEWAALYDG